MTTAASSMPHDSVDQSTYRRRVWAWVAYDWANSSFVTTVVAAVLPIYFNVSYG